MMQHRVCCAVFSIVLTFVAFQNLPSDEKSAMPPIDSIFAPPYPWLVKDARAGNVMRALSSGKKTTVTFNGHTHRGGDNKGG
jgi:hypothetical protein